MILGKRRLQWSSRQRLELPKTIAIWDGVRAEGHLVRSRADHLELKAQDVGGGAKSRPRSVRLPGTPREWEKKSLE